MTILWNALSSTTTTRASTPIESERKLEDLGIQPFDLKDELLKNEEFGKSVFRVMSEVREPFWLSRNKQERRSLEVAAEILIKLNPLKARAEMTPCNPKTVYYVYNPGQNDLNKLQNIKIACLNAAPSIQKKPFFQNFQIELASAEKAENENCSIRVLRQDLVI